MFQLNKTQINQETILINTAFKTILNIDRLTPTKEIYSKFKILSPKQIIWKNTMKYIHKANLGLINDTVLTKQILPTEISGYNLRGPTDFFVRTEKKEYFNKQWFVKGIKYYQDLPYEFFNLNMKTFNVRISELALSLELR